MEVTRNEDKQFAPNPEVKLHFLDYWRIVRIRKTVILAVFLLVSLTTTVVTFFLPEVYSSFVKVSIGDERVDVNPDLKTGQSGYSGSYDPFRMQTEFQRIQSRPVLEKVVERLNLRDEWGRKFKAPGPLTVEQAYFQLKGQIDVRQSQQSTLVEIHAFSDSKDEAAKLANEIADVYKETRRNVRLSVIEGGVKELEKDLLLKDKAITATQSLVNVLRSDLQISDYDAAGFQPSPTLDMETLRKVDTLVIEAQRTFINISNMYARLASLTRDELKNVAPVVLPGDRQLSELIAQESQAEVRLASLSGGGLGVEHAEMKAVTATLEQVRKHLDARLKGVIDGLRTSMETERNTMDTLRAQLDEARKQDSIIYTKTRPYYDAKKELAKMEMIRDKLAMSVEAERVNLRMPTQSSVEVIEPAVPTAKPVKPNKPLNIALGVIVGLIIGVGLAFFIEYLDTSVKTIDDVERALQAPVLGVIPQNVGLLIDEGPESPHGEAYRVLRTNVLFSRKDPKLNTLSIVSGGAGEGKSTTIFNLATVFAQNGQRVLIIDSDLRRPSLHRFLKVSNSVGLTDFLMKRATLEEVIQRSALPTLDFLPSGKLPSSSLGILSSVQMKELIRDVKRRYDFVFFDSPPIMGVSDASILASEVDMVLQVIQYRRYPQPMTIRAKQMIEKVGGNLLGIVLNNINMSQDENYYYYSGYYYDYYSKGEYASEDSKGEKAAPEALAAPGEQPKLEIKSKF